MFPIILSVGCLSAMLGTILFLVACLSPVKRWCNFMNLPCQYSGMCKNAKPYCFDSDTFHLPCTRRGWFECNKSSWYCPKCLNRDDPETCVDCDPVDPPCSLYNNSEGSY